MYFHLFGDLLIRPFKTKGKLLKGVRTVQR